MASWSAENATKAYLWALNMVGTREVFQNTNASQDVEMAIFSMACSLSLSGVLLLLLLQF